MTERASDGYGILIDRNKPVNFRFEDKEYTGFKGDTLSSALWANGVRVLGRSFKYHRARGIWGFSNIDSNSFVESESGTNIRADLLPISEGLEVKAVNTRGGVEKDRLRHLEKFSRFTPVGFYYKAFHTPKRLFPFYEDRIRQMAGLGRINPQKPIRNTPKDYAFCDVLVVGGGPAGLAAAITAAESGAKVLLVDEGRLLGGTLLYQLAGDASAQKHLEDSVATVHQLDNIEIRTQTEAVGAYSDGWWALVNDVCLTKVRAKTTVLATGCGEQPAVFRNNDLPGIMMASAAQRLLHLYAVKPFERGVALVANSDGYRAALDLVKAGIKISAIADLRPEGDSNGLSKEVSEAGVDVLNGWALYEATANSRRHGLESVVLTPLDGDGRPQVGDGRKLECDGVAMSVGWAPADGLLRQAGGRVKYDSSIEQFVPSLLPEGFFVAGRVNGVYDLESQIEDGQSAGSEATSFLGLNEKPPSARPSHTNSSASHPYPVFPHPKGKEFVELDEDLQVKDLENAIQEGYDSIELLKRFSTIGMGPSQGKHSNLLAGRILARCRGLDMEGRELSTARPFTTPVALSHLAGRIFTPRRRTPMHIRHEEEGAKFMYAGNWLRPEYYPKDGATREECILQEAANVRKGLGLIDLGTLGKLEISGPDAVDFIERIYTGKFKKLKVGMTRYGVACDETGIVIDDGILGRLGEDRFYVSTTTGGSDGVFRNLQRWAILWGSQVTIVNATNQYAAMNLAGQTSLETLKELTDIDLRPEAFPYLGIREGSVAGVPVRLTRVGFVGELGYEIHVPTDAAVGVWDAIMKAGEKHGIRPFGVEAQRLLRLEKGHIIIGQDTDALADPFEAELAWAVKMDKPFFVGQRSLRILQGKAAKRRLIGWTLPKGHAKPIPKENHLVIDRGEIAGRVTSVGFSPTMEQIIGLGYARPDQTQAGTKIAIRVDDGEMLEATVVDLPFYDPEGSRQNPVLEQKEGS